MSNLLSSLGLVAKEEDENAGFGKNRLIEKEQTIEDSKGAGFGLNAEELSGAAGRMFNKFLAESKSAVSNVKSALTPEFVNRVLNAKQYKLQIMKSEERLDEFDENVKQTIKEEHRFSKAAKERLERIKEMSAKRLAGELKQLEILRRDADKKKKAQRDDFQNNRRLQKIEAEKKEQASADVQAAIKAKEDEDRRTHITNFWSEQAGILQREAESNRKAYLERVKEDYDYTLNTLGEEFKDRELARAKMQVLPASTSSPIKLPESELGIFGTPLDPGDYFAIDGGYVPGLDQEDVHVFDSSPQTDFEESMFDINDFVGEMERDQGLYEALTQDAKYLDESLSRLVDMRSMHERDLRQLENEHTLILEAQKGPPKRLADKFEISSTHLRKEQMVRLNGRLKELEHSIDLAERKKRDKESQLLGLAQKIAVLGEKVKNFQNDVNNVNLGLGQLPLIVGRNISKIRGNGPTAKPKEYMDAVVQQSKFMTFQVVEKEAMKAHEARIGLDRNLWLARQSENELSMDVEKTFSGLADIQERLKVNAVNNLKLSIVEALKAFFNSGAKLNPQGLVPSGLLQWWKCRNPKLATNVECYAGGNALGGLTFEDPGDERVDSQNESGVVLGEALQGECFGIIKMPKMGMWNIVLSVTRVKQTVGLDDEEPDEHDYCTVRLGSSFGNLQLIDRFFNKLNPETGAVLYDAKFLLRGDKLAFRFDFSSSSSKVSSHLAVCTGFFEEYQMDALEVIPDPGGSSRERVLSSYVKLIRVDSVQGKNRLTKLLEELINCEDYKGDHWDSEILQNTPQRYGKSYFLKILKAEILAELHKAKTSGTARADYEFFMEEDGNDPENVRARRERLQASEKSYLDRKQTNQQYLIDRAEAIVGKFLEIYDEPTDAWLMCYVKDCNIAWIENGVTLKVTHTLEEVNKGGEVLNTLKLDLSVVRYFESAQQEFDAEAVKRWKQARKWKARLKELNDMADDAKTKYKDAFTKIKDEAESALDNEVAAAYRSFDEVSEQEAEAKLEDPRTQEWVSNRIPDLILDMRKGIIEREPDVPPRDQAVQIARDRFKANYMDVKRAALEKMAAAKRDRMQVRLGKKLEEFRQAEESYMSQLYAERYNLEWSIKEQWQLERDAAMAQLKFSPEVFEKVKPRADQCEHLKSKAWGTNYAIGVRCLECGKELTELYKEESQLLGYGSGTDPKMWADINRHRVDEAAFRADSSEHLKHVERERVRLEKERRVMEESEEYFYDFADLKCIYEFDQRHSMVIKKSGKFRQGLQWTEDQLNEYENKKRDMKKKELLKENMQLTLLDEYDPLSEVEQPPPTFRGQDERRKAQFNEVVFGIGRLHNFQKKISGLKKDRLGYLTDNALFSAVLTSLHRDSFVFDHELHDLEGDLDRTAKLLSTYEVMEKMWAQASKIERQAAREKKKAEMRHAGLWESVTEQVDVTTFLREETRELLKLKMVYEARFEELTRRVGDTRTVVMTAEEEFKKEEAEASALSYCKPGNHIETKYGPGTVCYFRAVDKMLLVLLSFGVPVAKLWIHMDEVVSVERAKQQGERLLMEIEDRTTMKIKKAEQISIRKELYLMRNEEEGMKEYWNFVDCMNNEKEETQDALEKDFAKSQTLTATKKFKFLTDKAGDELVEKKTKAQMEAIKAYKGPRSARPRKLTSKDVHQIRLELTNEMKSKFMAQKLRECEKNTHQMLMDRRTRYFERYIFDTMMTGFTDNFIEAVATEALVEGKEAKLAAEKASGLIFPVPKHMQHSSYRLIRDLWKDRKAYLTEMIEMKMGTAMKAENANKKVEVDENEAARLLEEKRLRKIERRRQKKLCAEMDREYLIAKEFYRWEMSQNLRERRQMRQNEEEMRKYLEEMERLKELSKSAYSVSDGNLEDVQKEAAATTHDSRRDELKVLVLERRKAKEETELMEEEDALSKLLMDLDRLERQKANFEKSFGKVKDGEDQAPVADADLVEVSENGEVVVPVWMILPENWVDMNKGAQHNYVYKETKNRNCRINVQKNNDKDRRRYEQIQKKGKREWRELFTVQNVKQWKSELEYMEREEQAKESEYLIAELKENMRKLDLFCRSKGEEELHARSKLKKMEELARKRTRELEEADAFLQLCARRSRTREKLKRRITQECMVVDTDSITGFHQRFTTYNLRDRLYEIYFNKIVISIINRAETIATERKQMKIQELLSSNRALLIDRTTALKWAWKDIQRDDLLRLRRSVLNKRFFPLARKRTLQERFGSWVRFFYWNRGIREAFTMKYEVLKRQGELDRQYKEQLAKEKKELSSPPKHVHGASTIMQKHRERTVQCSRCSQFYLESQNNCFACLFHPGLYQFSCPRYCQNPGLTRECAAHKRKRWTCCDSSKEVMQGCSRRYHVPKAEDPVYSALMKRVYQRDEDILADLEIRHEKAVKGDWVNKEIEIKRAQVFEFEHNLQNDRDKAVAFDNLKFI